MKFLKSMYDRANIAALKFMMFAGSALPGLAYAQNGQQAAPIDGMVGAICGLIKPITGQSKVLSLVFLIALGVMIFLWWMSENKEGVVTWILRTGIALGILINLITLPELVGLPPVC